MKYRIGYAAGIGEKDVLSTIDYVVENGMNAVEINMNMPCFFPENYSKEARNAIRLYRKEKDVVLTLHAPEDITLLQLHEEVREAGIKRLKEIVDFACDIGAIGITLHVGPSVYFTMTEGKCYMDDLHYEEFKQVLKNSLKGLADYCGERVKLCIENSGRFPKKLVQETLEEMLDKENLYLTWDIGHSYTNVYGEVEFFHQHLDSVKTCHLHDVNQISDHQIIGTGKVDFTGHFEKMGQREITYIVEVRPREKAVLSVNHLKKQLGI